MKRSAINDILGHTRQFFSQHDVHLPPFASFSPAQWQQLDTAAWEEVFDLKLGWDVTAFGGNNFAAQGLTLFTLRNGSAKGMPYVICEMLRREDHACARCAGHANALSLA